MPKMTMIARLSRDGPPLDLCSDGLNAPELQAQAREASKLFRQLASSTETYGTIESSPYNYHYCLEDSVCFMTVADKQFSKNVVFAFLDELKKEFMSQYGHTVGNETRPFAYMKFERFMQRTKTAFADPETKRNLDKLGTELKDVRSIMSANIQDVLQRGEKLNRAAEESHRLVEDSKLYKKSATSLNRWLWLRQWAPAGFVFTIVGGFFYLFYFR
jgi:vesicle transport protein SEC22